MADTEPTPAAAAAAAAPAEQPEVAVAAATESAEASKAEAKKPEEQTTSSSSSSNSTEKQEAAPAMSKEDAKKAVLKQVQFYMGDGNLPYDRFLYMQTRKDDGWVPISVLGSFKRMQAMSSVLSAEEMADALRQSPALLQVSDDGLKVKRITPLQPRPDAFERSVYAKGFPEDDSMTQAQELALQGALEKFFDQFGSIVSVRMRRFDHRHRERPKKFKGSVFVEFEDEKEMEAFLQLEPKPTFTAAQEAAGASAAAAEGGEAAGKPLLVMSKKDYCEMKIKEKGIDPKRQDRSGHNRPFNAFRELEKEAKGLPAFQEPGGQRNNDNKRKRDGDDEEDEGERPAKKSAAELRAEPLTFEYLGNTLTTTPEGTIDAAALSIPPQSVLAFEGAGAEGNWRDLKETLLTIHPTSFVEFPVGAVSGAVGFKSTLTDELLEQIRQREIQLGGKTISWARIDEDKAKQFYVERANFRAKNLLDKREAEQREAAEKKGRGGGGGGGRGGGRGRGGRGRGRGRGRGGNRGGKRD